MKRKLNTTIVIFGKKKIYCKIDFNSFVINLVTLIIE